MFEEKMSLDTTSAISALDVGSDSSYTPASIDSAPVETSFSGTYSFVFNECANPSGMPDYLALSHESEKNRAQYAENLTANEGGSNLTLTGFQGNALPQEGRGEQEQKRQEAASDQIREIGDILRAEQQRDAERYERLMAQNYEFAGINQSGHDWRELAEFQEDAKNREKVIERMMQQGNMDRSRAEQAANKAEELTSLVLQSIMGIISEDNRRRLRELENDPVVVEAINNTMNIKDQEQIEDHQNYKENYPENDEIFNGNKSSLFNVRSCSESFNPASSGTIQIPCKVANNNYTSVITPTAPQTTVSVSF
jgi:hypothetical protein